jgi:hypothetical protein
VATIKNTIFFLLPFLYKVKEQESRTGPGRDGLVPVRGKEEVGKW